MANEHTHLENAKYTILKSNAAVSTAGTVDGTWVPVTGYLNNTVLFNVGTVTAGSIHQLFVMRATNVGGSNAAPIAGATLTAVGTLPGIYGIEIAAEMINDGTLPLNGTNFITARAVIPAAGSAFYGAMLEQTNPRRAPTANGLAGSALVLH